MEAKALGKAIKELRKDSGVGLRELGRKADISPASLLATEKGESSPTLATLIKILKALDTDLAEFFTSSAEKEKNKGPVFSSKNMDVATGKHREYVFLLPKRLDIKFGMLYETIAPTEIESEWEISEYDIGGTILAGGRAKLEIDGQGSWDVRKGDSFYIKAGLKHRLKNIGKRDLKQITVQYQP